MNDYTKNDEIVNTSLEHDVINANEILQEQIDFHKSNAEKFKNNKSTYRHAKHLETAANFRFVRDLIKELQEEINCLKSGFEVNKPINLSLSPKDIENLPEELVKELSITNADRVEFAIQSMIEDAGGIMSLDQIIVGLFNQTGEINKRPQITAKLYRMSQKGLIYGVPLKKGVYSIKEISEDEAREIFKGSILINNTIDKDK